MSIIVIILIVLLLGGGGWYGMGQGWYGGAGFGGVVGLLVLILVLYWLFGRGTPS